MKIPTAMDDSSVSHHNGGQVGSQIGVSVNNKQNDEPSQSVQYSIPGILHFIQHEWARFELERSQWEVDRAEFEARIAFLQGERKGQENLKNDLVRRIKMLEYALKQERAKFHKLKYGVELQQGDVRPPPDEPTAEPEPAERAQWKQGRQLIKQYLQEIGYTDTILDVRSNRVRALLGLNNEEVENPNYRNYDKQQHDRCDYSMNHMVRKYDYDTGKEPRKSGVSAGGGYNEEGISVQETAAVFANFEFLTNQEMDMDEIDDLDAKQSHHTPGKQGEEVDHEAEEVLNELNLLTEREADGGGQGDEYPVGGGASGANAANTGAGAGAGEADEEPLALGELAQLTVSNEPEAYDVASANKESFRKTWNAKYTLRSHFDGVRALAFHPTEAALVTASEDHTLKLWNLQRTVPAKKSAGLDVEPLYTFRAHTAPVLCLAMGAPRSEECFSGGLDGTIRVWNLPPPTADPYDPYDPAVQGAVLREHTDAVWSLSSAHGRLLSASADGTVRLWAPRAPRPLLATLRADDSPTATAPAAADFADAAARAAVVYRDGTLLLYDLETGQPVLRVACDSAASRVRAHPSLPLLVTAHEDRHIRFWDAVSGRCAHAMVAHLDAVTGLALDPNGLFLLSGSHDCSVRLWNLDTKTCVQEITAHRKKFDESILDVAFHPLRPYIASAGADGLAKVFV
ncbi:striatin-3 [Trichoplusia ni]|uniref:Striatin-3 n=1 Tax=Trichoplusia ni TaxID=7111 RepID=A0A7E5VW16_TRINI|nr:striatin-3 [Trichoplusia ni]